MAFDYKKEYKEFYLPKGRPSVVKVPEMNFVAVRGAGNPNDEDSTYKQAVGVLYAVAYTLKMSYMGDYKIDGYFQYVVPPLEGFWWQTDINGIDYNKKAEFQWISVIRLPEFIKKDDFDWAKAEAEHKKKMDCSKAEFMTVEEGLCVQIMHLGPFDNEPASVKMMDEYIAKEGFVNDITETRMHHEIYLSDPRRTAPEKLKTIIRHPIKKG